MTITIRVEGAQPEEIVRGLLAAQDVFDKAGVTPDQAAMARFVVEGWDIRGFTGKYPKKNSPSAPSGMRPTKRQCRPAAPAGTPTKCQIQPISSFFVNHSASASRRRKSAASGCSNPPWPAFSKRCARKAISMMAARKMRSLSTRTL